MSISSLRFVLMVVMTGIMFVRPNELIESLEDVPLYQIAILSNLMISAPLILRQLTTDSLRVSPITACVVGLLAAVALSHLSHFALGEAVSSTVTFLKVVLSYLVLICAVNTTGRLRLYMLWLFVFILGLTILSLCQHYEIINVPSLAGHTERVFDKESGEVIGMNSRLCGAGIFANPNDLSRILVVAIVLSLYFFDCGAPAFLRPVWVVAIAVFGHALVLTMSRGGFIALAAALFVLFRDRFGTRISLILAGIALPVMALAIGGRQTDLSTSEGTGQQRIRLWSDGLVAMRSSPLFGTGMDTYEGFTHGYGAHNSFVHTYVELGFFGGTLFLGAMLGGSWMCFRMGSRPERRANPNLERMRPYLLAILVGYAAGMLSSSRCYAFPTYVLLGLIVVYLRLARADKALPAFRVNSHMVMRLALLSILALAAIQFYVLTTVQFGTKL